MKESRGEDTGIEREPVRVRLVMLVTTNPIPVYTATDKYIERNSPYFLVKNNDGTVLSDQLLSRLWGTAGLYWRGQKELQIQHQGVISLTPEIELLVEGEVTWLRGHEILETIRRLARAAINEKNF